MAKRNRKHIANTEQRATRYDESSAGNPIVVLIGDKVGVYVTPETALGVPSVKRCVELIAGMIATFNIYKTKDIDGKPIRQADDNLTYLLDYKPNGYMDSYEFWFEQVSTTIVKGNSFCEIVWLNNNPVALNPIPPDQVTVKWDSNEHRIKYHVRGQDKPFDQRDILHFKSGLKDHGNRLIGLSTIENNRQAIALALAAQEMATNFLQDGMMQQGHYTVINGTNETVKQVNEMLDRNYAGTKNAGKTAVFRDNVVWVARSVDPDKAQLLDTRKNQDNQIAMAFSVPPAMLTLDATYAGNAQSLQSFYSNCLLGWLTMIEQQLDAKLLRDSREHIVFDYSQLLRADQTTQRNLMNLDITYSRATPNQQLALLGEPPIEGGDTLYAPANLVPVNKAAPRFDPAQINQLIVQANKGEISPEQAKAFAKASFPKLSDDELQAFFPAKAEPVTPATETPTEAAPEATAEVVADEQGERPAAAEPVEPAAAALNGAQITSFIGVLQAAANGQIPLASVEPILVASFPSLAKATIAELVKSLDGFTPAIPGDSTPPANTDEPAAEAEPGEVRGTDVTLNAQNAHLEAISVAAETTDTGESEATQPEATSRAATVTTQRGLLAGVLRPLLDLERNTRKRGVLSADWLTEHQGRIAERVRPVVESCRSLGLEVVDAEEIATGWINTTKESNDQEGEALDALLFNWKCSRVGDACNKHVQ